MYTHTRTHKHTQSPKPDSAKSEGGLKQRQRPQPSQTLTLDPSGTNTQGSFQCTQGLFWEYAGRFWECEFEATPTTAPLSDSHAWPIRYTFWKVSSWHIVRDTLFVTHSWIMIYDHIQWLVPLIYWRSIHVLKQRQQPRPTQTVTFDSCPSHVLWGVSHLIRSDILVNMLGSQIDWTHHADWVRLDVIYVYVYLCICICTWDAFSEALAHCCIN